MSSPTNYRKIKLILDYLKNASVNKSSKIEYLKKRNGVAMRALTEAKRQYNRNKRPNKTLLTYPHFNAHVLNSVQIKNIFNNTQNINQLLTNYKNYPTIIRIIEKNKRNAVRGAYGEMLKLGLPMNVILNIQKKVGNNTSTKHMIQEMLRKQLHRP